jgi:cytochrome b
VRIAHWSVAVLVVYDWIDDSGDQLHRVAGYAAAAIVVLRLLYGVRAGPAGLHWPSPAAALRYVLGMTRGEVTRYAGHNPAGNAMAWILWSLVMTLAITGFVARLDAFWGDDWPVVIHAWLSTALQIAVVLHLLGVIASSVLERQNLVAAMVHGRKQIDPRVRRSGPPGDG